MNKKEKIDLILRRTVEVYNKESLLKKLNGEKNWLLNLEQIHQDQIYI